MYQVETCAQVYVDSCVRNESGALVFMSVFGRDTGVKELIARIQLEKSAQSLRELRLKGTGDLQGDNHLVTIHNANELEKLTGRLPKCIYGALTHTWIFDPAINAPDKGAKQAWILEPWVNGRPPAKERLDQRIWQTISYLASIPLLPHWQEPVLTGMGDELVTRMGANNANPRFSAPIGGIQAHRVRLGDDFGSRISSMVQNGELTLEPPQPMPLLAAA